MPEELPGSILPVPDQQYQGPIYFDARHATEKLPAITAKRPPAGAPNVLLILLDDVGFGASSAFGGPVNTPTAERLAGGGLKYTRFHTTSLCSPTRAAMLTGRNHHAVGMGHITETATPAPDTGRRGRARAHRRPRSSARVVTTQHSSESSTRSRCGSRGRRDRSATGRHSVGSNASTDLSAARPTNGSLRSSTG